MVFLFNQKEGDRNFVRFIASGNTFYEAASCAYSSALK